MVELTWAPDIVRLGDIQLWDRNPKKMSKTRADRLLSYWGKIGQFQTLAIGPNGECYDGHQRVNALRAADYPANHELHVMRSNRPLTEKEREELVIASSVGTTGQLDFDELSDWDVGDLMEWGLDTELLDELNSDAAALREMLEVARAEEELEEVEQEIRPREMARVLVSIPVDLTPDAKLILDQLEDIDGIEMLYGAN